VRTLKDIVNSIPEIKPQEHDFDTNRSYWMAKLSARCNFDFPFFTEHVLGCKLSEFHKEPVPFIYNSKLILIIWARGHLKTTIWSECYSIWRMWKERGIEIAITSSALEQSQRVIENIEARIENNEFLKELIPKDKQATWNKSGLVTENGNRCFQKPFNSSTRGTHVDYYVCDDILREENLSQEQIKDFFWSIIFPCIQTRKGQMLVVGTPMTMKDLFAEIRDMPEWKIIRRPCVYVDNNGKWIKPVWHEKFNLDELKNLKEKMGSLRFEREYLCLNPETKIQTENGLKKIKDITIGENVLTHKGNLKKVLNVFSRRINEKIINLSVFGLTEKIRITSNHPILTKRGFIQAGSLTTNDFVMMPKLNKEENDYGFDLDDMVIFGYYLAEGTLGSNNRSVSFSFYSKQRNYIEELKKALINKGFLPKEYTYKSVTYVYVNSVNLVMDLQYFFSKLSYQKKIPFGFKNLDEDLIRKLIECYINGDGNYSKDRNCIEICSVSENLLNGTSLLLNRLGLACTLSFEKVKERRVKIIDRYSNCRPTHILRIVGDAYKKFIRSTDKSISYKLISSNNGLFYKVRKIEKENYDGIVYNLEVEDDNSYCLANFAVHNCNPMGGGATIFKNIRIGKHSELDKPLPTEDYFIGVDVAMKEGPKNDFTVFSILGKDTKTGMIRQRKMERYKGYTDDEIIKRLRGLNQKFRPKRILIENAGISVGTVKNLQNKIKYPDIADVVDGFVSNKRERKEEIISAISVGFETGVLEVLDNTIQYNELCGFKAKEDRSGKVTYEGVGEHDDTVIALGLAMVAIQMEELGTASIDFF